MHEFEKAVREVHDENNVPAAEEVISKILYRQWKLVIERIQGYFSRQSHLQTDFLTALHGLAEHYDILAHHAKVYHRLARRTEKHLLGLHKLLSEGRTHDKQSIDTVQQLQAQLSYALFPQENVVEFRSTYINRGFVKLLREAA
ncbi:hypothetical protein GOV07_04080 [Candidatus Woesearchaeota archaeon]|nr:hypothetical protein [Candidatus Woesearchaeota archaeon]